MAYFFMVTNFVLRKTIAILIVLFIFFKVYFATIVFTNLTMWSIFWYCNLAWIILAIGIYQKSKVLIALVLITSTTEIAWYIELFSIVFNIDYSLPLLGYLLQDRDFDVVIVDRMSFIVHIFLLPISLYCVKKIGFTAKALIPTLIFTTLLLIISYIISINSNVHLNCATNLSNCNLFNNVDDFTNLILIMTAAISWVFFFLFLFYFIFAKKQ